MTRAGAESGEKKQLRGYEAARVLSALAIDGCPVCHEIEDHDRAYFFWFFNESYSEGFTLDALTDSLGFCPMHGKSLAQTSAGSYALTFVHHIMASRTRATLSRCLSPGGGKARPWSRLASQAVCPPCRSRSEDTEREAFWVAKLFVDPEAAECYARPGILCFPHLQRVHPKVPGPLFERLLRVHLETMNDALKSSSDVEAECGTGTADRARLASGLLPLLHLAVGHRRPGPRFLGLVSGLQRRARGIRSVSW